MFRKILIGIILFGIVAMLLLQVDDDLNPEVALFLKQAEPAESSEAYLYLLGIVAAEDEEPIAVGKQLLASMRQAEEQYTFGDETFAFEDYPEEKKLALPEGKLFCSSWEENCWQTIFANKKEIDQAVKTHAVLLQRYQTFIQLDDYHTLAKPIVMEQFPAFQYLTKANRLVLLNAVNTADRGEAVATIDDLTAHIAVLRKHLKGADNLIGKMIFGVLISESLDVLSLIIHQQNSVFNGEIPSLSVIERDLGTVMPREFAMGHDIYMSLDKNPEFFSQTGRGTTISAPGWLVRTVFKPNMSINKVYLFYKEIIARSQLEPAKFAATELGQPTSLRFRFAYIRNPVGSILNDVASPNWDQYITRLLDLNAKIEIFNQTANKLEIPINLDTLQNPYYETAGTAYYSDDGNNICLTGPLDDDKNQRCLRVKL